MPRLTYYPQPPAEDAESSFTNHQKYGAPKDREPQPNQYSQHWGTGSMLSDREKQEPSSNAAHDFSVGPQNESLCGTGNSGARRGEGYGRGQQEDDSAEVLWPAAHQRNPTAQAARAEQEQEGISWIANVNQQRSERERVQQQS